jgi:hypothetical protein
MRSVMVAPRRGIGGAVLYLDFDGVLHPEAVYWHPKRGVHLGAGTEGHQLFEHAALLESLLEPYPDLRIVLSTSWVRQFRFSGAARRLPVGLRRRCIGATFHSRMDEGEFESMGRGQQVMNDVGRRFPRAWVALDDCTDGWPAHVRGQVVITHLMEGIAHPPVTEVLRHRLTERFGPTSLKVRR